MQLIAEKEIFIVVAWLVVHFYAIKKNVIVASRLNDVAGLQFTVEQCVSTGVPWDLSVPWNLSVPVVSVAGGSAKTDRRFLERN